MTASTPSPTDRVAIAGLAGAGLGLAHFVAPQAFAPITRPLFPHNTTSWTYRNGAAETVIGIGFVAPATRPVATVALIAYVGFLATRAVRAAH
nr:hypothetical protein [Gordonia sp. LAM0048]